MMPVKSRNTAMSGSPEPNPQQEADVLEVATEQVIAACDGDLRAAVQALIVANSLLEAELNDVYAAASKGYARGKGQEEQTGLRGIRDMRQDLRATICALILANESLEYELQTKVHARRKTRRVQYVLLDNPGLHVASHHR